MPLTLKICPGDFRQLSSFIRLLLMSSEKEADLTDTFSFAVIRQQENIPRLGMLYAHYAVSHGKGAIYVKLRKLECVHICQ